MMQEVRHMKYAISFFGVLLLVISVMLIFQFQVYSDKLESGEGEFSYTQEIEIVYRNNSLDIRQHFKNLPNQTIEIKWPNQAINPDCFMDSENSCKRLNEEKTEFKKGENQTQSLSYIIPLDHGLKSKQLLKDIFVTLQNGKVTYSTVHISTDQEVLGQWVTGLPLIGQQSLSLVNYTMFSGTGPVSEVYWQDGNLKLQEKSDAISIFGKEQIPSSFLKQLKSLKLLNDAHISIVHGENLTGQQGNRILFLKDLSMDSLNKNVILSQVKSLYNFGDSPQWLVEVVASYLTGFAVEDGKSSKIIHTLTNQMTEEQLQDWVNELNKLKGEKISAKVLDDVLSKIFNMHTDYLSLNELSKGVYPFLFNDSRELYVNSHLEDDVNVIFKEDQIFYTADTLLKHLGYDVSIGENGYYVSNETREFRFPKGYGFYVYNQRRYNTVSAPIIQIAGDYYIEESWLQKLFLVEINKNDDAIILKAATTLQQ